MPPWLLKLPALIRAYGPSLLQAYFAVREVMGRWRKKEVAVAETPVNEDKEG